MKLPGILSILCIILFTEAEAQQTVGLFQYDQGTADGYVLFAPLSSNYTYLIDNCGREVHKWESNQSPGASVYLLENGKLLRTGRTNSPYFSAGGTGGMVEILDWNSNVEWTYTISDTTQRQHHDIEYLPNGNILAIVWELKTELECIQAGRDTGTVPGELWPEKIIEIQPIGTDSAEIVWEWHTWDHLIQDFDNTRNNYGVVADHPELLNANYLGTPSVSNSDWLHMNGIAYNPDLDQIVMSSHRFDEIWIIDHSTTAAEAAGHTGGNSGKGGDILYRYGNPQAYNRGTGNDRVLFNQHNPSWIPAGLPGAGDITIFNNGENGPNAYSTVDQITPPVDGNGNYTMSGQTFGPSALTWQYAASPLTDFFSGNISGAQRLANGNTIICEGANGRFFEVDSFGDIVWEYINPVNLNGPITQGNAPNGNSAFRCTRYPEDYAGFNGQTLTPGEPIEINPIQNNCSILTQTEASDLLEETRISVYPNPARDVLTVERSTNHGVLEVSIYDMNGKQLVNRKLASGNFRMMIDLNTYSSGLYSIRLSNGYDTQASMFSVVK